MLPRSAALVFPVLCGVLQAQALQVSRAAAAPTRDDSVYALRVDSAAYPGHDEVLLLDEGVVRVEADGRSSYTMRQVVQLLTTDAVENWGELTFWYTAGRQRMTINRIRVIGADGSVLHEGPAHQEDVKPPAEPGAPVFSDRRGVQVTLAGLAPGALIDYSSTLETVQPAVPGDFFYLWDVNSAAPIRRSRFALDVPAGLNARVRVRNVAGEPADTVIAGRRVRRWTLADVPAIDWQSYAGSPNAVVASIRVSGDVTWRAVGLWYDSLSRSRFQLTDTIAAALADQVRGAKTLEDSLEAAYRWVAQDFRYVSLSLGDGSYRPRFPREVFESRFGDCKDKTTLFVTLARRMGVVAYPVLVNSSGGVDSTLPGMKQFDHLIAAVELRDMTRYLDVTASLLPYGEVPAGLQGEVGLAMPASGPRLVVLPYAPADANRYDKEIVGRFTRDGSFIGRLSITASGTYQYDLRSELADLRQEESADRDQTIRRHVRALYASAAVDSERYSDGRDLRAPVDLKVWFTAARVVGHVTGAKYYFNLPVGRFTNPEYLTRLEEEGPRRFPIDVARVNSPAVYRAALEVELPDGWKAELPSDVSVEGPFGYYRARYSQAGRVLRVSREMGGGRGLLPPDSLGALRAWLQAVAADRATMIVLSRGTGEDLVAEGTEAGADRGDLPQVVLDVADLGDGAKLAQEGADQGSSEFLDVSPEHPVASFHRAFKARQVVFSVGDSRIAMLQASVAAYRTPGEAEWMVDMWDLMDLRGMMGAFLKQSGMKQIEMGTGRKVEMDGIGDRGVGWVLEVITPVAPVDLAMLFATRGRVSIALVAYGVKGLQDADLVALMRTMDERVRRHDAYLTAIENDSSEGVSDVAAADSALAAATTVPLNRIPVYPPDSTGRTTRSASFERENGWPRYTLTIQGRAFTFPYGRTPALEVALEVTLHGSEAEALEEVVVAARTDPTQFVRRSVGEFAGMPGLAQAMSDGDSTSVEHVAMPRLGARSQALVGRLRGMLRVDMDEVVLARGKLTATVLVTRPPGASDPSSAMTLARDMLQRMRALDPGTSEATPPSRLVAAITRVIEAERAVDSLVEAKDIATAFRVVDKARLGRAPVGFSASTWNGLCWRASLDGQAKRAKPACEAAVAPDTTVLAFRDSRGLQRALVGDLQGARDDFAYVVMNADAGAFHDTRADWLSSLRAGQNPFTPAVLQQLREE